MEVSGRISGRPSDYSGEFIIYKGCKGMLSKVTIIIPTYNNMHYYLDRILEYYRDSGIKIMIADDSPDAYKNAGNYSNVHYVHFKKCRSYTEKLYLSLQKIETPYVIICDQDDFILPESVEKCIAFLEEHPDYMSAQGNVIYFNPKQPKKIVWSPALLNMVGFDLDAASPADRIRKYFSDYIGLYIAVHRKDSAMRAFTLVYDTPLEKHFGLLEYFTDFIYAINGKHIVLPVFYDAKETLHIIGKHNSFNLKSFSESRDVSVDFQLFVDTIANDLALAEGTDISEAEMVVTSALKAYFGFSDATVYATPERLAQPVKSRMLKRMISHIPFIDVVKKKYVAEMRKHVLKRRIKDRINLIDATRKLPGFPFYDRAAVEQKQNIEKYILNYWDTTYKKYSL
jgi:glycosyltransferase domain-containing protein